MWYSHWSFAPASALSTSSRSYHQPSSSSAAVREAANDVGEAGSATAVRIATERVGEAADDAAAVRVATERVGEACDGAAA
eukprot:2005446-Alexandrium_andersonii.AAC.1